MNIRLLVVVVALIELANAIPVFAEEQTVSTQQAALAATSVGAQVAERPSIKVGDSWEYVVWDTRFARKKCTYSQVVTSVIDGKINEDLQNPNHCELSALTAGSTYDLDLNVMLDTVTYRAYSFPLEVGKQWDQKFHYSIGSKSWSNNATTKVVAIEKVSVGAVTYDAFKIVGERKYQGSGNGYAWSGTVQEVRWYAPLVKNWVKKTTTTTDSANGISPFEGEVVSFHHSQ